MHTIESLNLSEINSSTINCIHLKGTREQNDGTSPTQPEVAKSVIRIIDQFNSNSIIRIIPQLK